MMFLALLLAALVVAGCGKTENELKGTEGSQVSINGLDYQVQISRQLNPHDQEDMSYTHGHPDPPPGEGFFGVFISVVNNNSGSMKDAERKMPIGIEKMKIVDTMGNEFRPIKADSPGFAYVPSLLGPGGKIPLPSSAAQSGPIQGALILFQLPVSAQDNRPLKLVIDGGGEKGEIQLDA